MFFHIPAFFDGWFAKGDKVHSLSVMNNIVICCDDNLFAELKRLFFETNVVLVKENKPVLKQKTAEMLVRNLLMLVYEKNISTILCDKKKLNKVEEIVREFCLKLFAKEKDVEEKKVLQHLYDVSDDARADFCKKSLLAELFKFSEISKVNTPNVYEMMLKLIKK